MSLDLKGKDPKLEQIVLQGLLGLLLDLSDLNPDELRRCCERVFSSESARTFLVDPTKKLPDEVSHIMDSLVLRVLNSTESTPNEKADSLSYLIRPESLARVRKEAIVAIENILDSMVSDIGLRSADTNWHQNSHNIVRSLTGRVQEYDGMFGNPGTQTLLPFSIFVLRFVSAANLTVELVQPLKELANSSLKSIQPIAPELLTLQMNTFNLYKAETNPKIYLLNAIPT